MVLIIRPKRRLQLTSISELYKVGTQSLPETRDKM